MPRVTRPAGQLPLRFEQAAPSGSPPPAPPPPPRGRGGVLRAARRGALFGALLLLVAWASGQITMRLALEKDKVDLPRVVGLESVAAIELLKEQGLAPKIVAEEYSNRVARGRIATQQPAGAMRVRPGAEVRLIVSRGSDTATTPDLAGRSLPDAQRLLSEQGLRVGTVTEVRVEHQPAGVVIAHEPAAGETAQRGTAVDVLVNAGGAQEAAAMPNLVGQPVREALERLQALGVEVRVSFERSERMRDAILRQEPPAGGALRRGERALLVVGQ